MSLNKSIFFMLIAMEMVIGCSDNSGMNGKEDTCPNMTLVNCMGICIDPNISNKFCGADENCENYDVCSPDEYCDFGFCKSNLSPEPTCDIHGYVRCSDECIDPMTSNLFCGADENCTHFEICQDAQNCEQGKCTPEIPNMSSCEFSWQVKCNGECINPDVSQEFCGADENCENYDVCSPDEYCEFGFCKSNLSPEPTCDIYGYVRCSDECIDPMTSNLFCGANENCDLFQICNSYETCEQGVCQSVHTPCENINEVRCDGTCIDPQTSMDFCGADSECNYFERCNHVDETCFEGQCVYIDANPCEIDGQVKCEGTCIDPNTSNDYCGATNDCLFYQHCGPYEKCVEGVCTEQELVGSACDASLFKIQCHGDSLLSCVDGVIQEVKCREHGLTCLGVSCVPLKDSYCNSKTFQSFCAGNDYIYCDNRIISRKCSLEGDICTTVNGTTGCYSACISETSTNACTNSGDYSTTGTCVTSDDGKHLVLTVKDDGNETLSIECSQDNNELCLQERCQNISELVDNLKCGTDQETGVCLNYEPMAMTLNCSYYYGWYNAVCYENESCVIHDNKAICAEPCSEDLVDSTRVYCAPSRNSKPIRLDSVTDKCMAVDGSFYWINLSRDSCYSNDCVAKTGKCVSSSDYSSGRMKCYESNATRKICHTDSTGTTFSADGNVYDNFESHSIKQTCTGGYWVYKDEDKELCYHGCDSLTGECIKIADWEGESCEDNGCQDNYIVRCKNNKKVAYSCDGYLCSDETYWSSCVEPCTADEVGHKKDFRCSESSGTKKSIYNICTEHTNASGEKIYYYTNGEDKCYHGCDDTGQCILLHEAENTPCNSSTDNDYCADALQLMCTNNKWKATSCVTATKKNGTCLESSSNYTYCVDACSASEVNQTRYKCDDSDFWHERLNLETCIQNGDNYYWSRIDSYDRYSCENGCDPETDRCKKIDPVEGTPCNTNSYKGVCLDNYYSYCDPTTDRIAFKSCESQVCAYSDENAAGCYAACTEDEIDVTKTACSTWHSYYLTHQTCQKIGDKTVWVLEDEFCYHKCDQTNDRCTPPESTIGDTCDPESFKSVCIDSKTYQSCIENTVVDSACEGDTLCTVGSGGIAKCEAMACTPGTIIARTCHTSKYADLRECQQNYQNGSYSYNMYGTYYTHCIAGCNYSTGKCNPIP